jgi:hypothetical protein
MGSLMRLRGAALVLILSAAAMFLLLGSGQAPALALQRPPSVRLPDHVGHPIELLQQSLGRSSSSGAITSKDWAGYDTSGGDLKSVTASWIEPPIPGSLSDSCAGFWVGLDGHGSSTVEQTGTVACSEGGSVYYYAWYEMYPDDAVPISGMIVNPGDEMTGTVTSDGAGDFTLSLVDDTTHVSFTTKQTNGVTAPVSAEVIAEAPVDANDSTLQLPEFGSVSFTGCAFNGQPISAFAYEQIDMVSADDVIEAATSALGTDGASFSVSSYPGDINTPASVASGYGGGWHNSAVQVTLIATDYAGGSGVKSITYSIDGGVPTTVNATTTRVTIGAPADNSNDGVHTLSSYATDNDGTRGRARSVLVEIDTMPPQLFRSGATNGAWLNHAATVTLNAASVYPSSASDASDVASIEYTLDGVAHTSAEWRATKVVIPASPNATHKLTFHATDLAGNVSANGHFSVHLDTIAPTIVAKPANGRKGKVVRLKYLVRDNLSPLAKAVTLTIRNSHSKVVETFKLRRKKVSSWHVVKWTPKAKGSYRYTATAKDLAGNKQAKAGSAKITVK